MKFARVALVATAAFVSGCHTTESPSTPTLPPEPEAEYTRSEVEPDAILPKRGRHTLAGVEIPVEVVTVRRGDRFEVLLRHDGEVEDRETYVSEDSRFALARAASETFSPPLDLIRFPLVVGRTHGWTGQVVFSDKSLPAEATITSAKVATQVAGNPTSAIIVTVDLRISPKEAPSSRKLSFTFVPHEGLLVREFGAEVVSRREPALP